MKSFAYLSKIYFDKETEQPCFFELLVEEESDVSNNYGLFYLNREDLNKMYADYIDKWVMDFVAEEGKPLKADALTPRSLMPSYMQAIESGTCKFIGTTCPPTIFELLWEIVKCKGFLIYDDSLVEQLLTGEEVISSEGYTKLNNLKFSKSTLNTFIRVKTQEGWRSRSLVYLDTDGVIKSNKFTFAIPKSSLSKMHPFEITCLGSGNLNTSEILLFEYDYSLNLFKHTQNSFYYSPAHLVRHIFYATYAEYAEFSVNQALAVIDKIFKVEKSVALEKQERDYQPKNRFYLNFILQPSPIKKSVLSDFLVEILNKYFNSLLAKQITIKDILSEVKNQNKDIFTQVAVQMYLEVILTGVSYLDKIEYANNLLSQIRDKYVRDSLYVYTFKCDAYAQKFTFDTWKTPVQIGGGGLDHYLIVSRSYKEEM